MQNNTKSFLDKCQYTEFNGKHPRAKKGEREYFSEPNESWISYGVKYPEGYLKIDIDDVSHSDRSGEMVNPIHGKPRSQTVLKILKDRNYKFFGVKTSHGVHLIFKVPEGMERKNKQNWVCPIGVSLEWHFPESDDHIPLKVNTHQRQIFSDPDTIDELPFFLKPIQKSLKRPFDMDFLPGERTQPLGGFLFYLVRDKAFSADQAFECVRIMNDYVFDNPIPTDTLDAQILNDSTFDKLQNAQVDIKNGVICPETFSRFLLQNNITVRYNSLLNLVEYGGISEDARFCDIADVQNVMPIKLQYEFEKFTKKRVGKLQVTDLILLEADTHSYNPVQDYLKAGKWDQKDRFPELFKILGVSDRLEKALIRKWFYQAAALPFNTIEKPFQAEGVLILQGAEGIGKSRFFQQITPNALWFSSLNREFATFDKDALIQLLSVWIAEFGECDRTFGADRSDIKNFITSPTDTIRKPYRREPVTAARHTAFAGTTNKEKFLTVNTGSRRWWVIHISQKIEMQEFSQPDNLHQFWIQCFTAYKNNPNCFRLSDNELSEVMKRNSTQREPVQGEMEILARLNFKAPVDSWVWVQPTALKSLPEFNVFRLDAKTIGNALTVIRQDHPEIEKRRRHGRMEYLLPPSIITDRYGTTQ